MPSRQDQGALLIDIHLHGIHLVIGRGNLLPQLALGFEKGFEAIADLFFHQPPHIQRLIAYLLELLVEAIRNMLCQVQIGIHLYSPCG